LAAETMDRSKVRGAVFRAVEQANQLSANGRAVETAESAVLLGGGTGLDSMGFINFVVALEEEVNHLTGRTPDLVQMIQAAEVSGHPISTVGQLIDVLAGQMD
jgi:hypothetical protein